MSVTALQKSTDGRDYAAALLDRQEYQDELKKRLDSGKVSPQLEVHLHKLRYGNPVNIEPEQKVNKFSGMSDEELAQRVIFLQQQVVQLLGPVTIVQNQEPQTILIPAGGVTAEAPSK